MLGRDSEDEIWSRFVFEFVIWPQEVTLVRWTQSSGPLCLWQCFSFIRGHWHWHWLHPGKERLGDVLTVLRVYWLSELQGLCPLQWWSLCFLPPSPASTASPACSQGQSCSLGHWRELERGDSGRGGTGREGKMGITIFFSFHFGTEHCSVNSKGAGRGY